MNKILLLLSISIKPTNKFSITGNQRIFQYKEGLNKLFEYNDTFIKNNIDIILFDNTIDNINEIPTIILNILPNNVKIITKRVNIYGCFNKGAGLIEQWIYNKEIISKYDWLIHFEPRQLLKSNQFIYNFLQNKCNLFNINRNVKHFNTGLFCINTTYLIKYINNINLNNFVSKHICIEDDLYNYFIDNNILFKTLDKMDLIWFNFNNIYHM